MINVYNTITLRYNGYSLSLSLGDVDVDAPDFWEQLIPDLRSPAKLLKRLQNQDELKSEQVQKEILTAMDEHVDSVILAHQQGISPDELADVWPQTRLLSLSNPPRSSPLWEPLW